MQQAQRISNYKMADLKLRWKLVQTTLHISKLVHENERQPFMKPAWCGAAEVYRRFARYSANKRIRISQPHDELIKRSNALGLTAYPYLPEDGTLYPFMVVSYTQIIPANEIISLGEVAARVDGDA